MIERTVKISWPKQHPLVMFFKEKDGAWPVDTI